jgi:hypothetical protein
MQAQARETTPHHFTPPACSVLHLRALSSARTVEDHWAENTLPRLTSRVLAEQRIGFCASWIVEKSQNARACRKSHSAEVLLIRAATAASVRFFFRVLATMKRTRQR